MEQYIIKGGCPLHGEVEIGGAKNAALGILAASIMTDETVLIENLPDVRDINVMLEAMSEIGVNLSPVECACIVHHMGAFGLDEKRLKEYDAALDVYPSEIIATHTADILAARVDERGVF